MSLQVAPGEFVALLGPSGSGKTTTLMLIAGFVLPDQGQILLDGADITSLPPHNRNLGMVYQNYALFPHLTIERNVAFPLEMRRLPREETRRRVRQALELVQLATMGARYPRQLSGGQQQRVALARALVFQPPVLLMDEPLGALDRKLRGEMQHEIKAIQRRLGITTIYVTHDQEEALSMADRVVVMRNGCVEQAAPPTELYDRPANEFVAEFIGAANLLFARVTNSGACIKVQTAGGLTFTAANGAGLPIGASVMAVIRPERIVIRLAAAEKGGVAASIAEASFAGGLWRYYVKLASGERMLVTQNNLGVMPFKPGDAVSLCWGAGDVWLVPTKE
ncbi:MAG TPA: ABC transporter ATP-binding protein [Candidatus Binatia bacterium]|nr:ABC transporter ATP-binding protein [Candidatus Binatia bacterium]